MAASYLAAGIGLQIGSSLMGAIEARRIGKYNARVAEANAQQEAYNILNEAQQQERIANMIGGEIDVLQEIAAFNEARLTETLKRQEGRLVAMVGASGLAFEGSPVAALEESARQGHIQILTQRYQTLLQTRALQEEQTQRRYAATLARFQAGNRLRLGAQRSTLIRAGAQQQFTAGILNALGVGIKGTSILGKSGSATPGTITRTGGSYGVPGGGE